MNDKIWSMQLIFTQYFLNYFSDFCHCHRFQHYRIDSQLSILKLIIIGAITITSIMNLTQSSCGVSKERISILIPLTYTLLNLCFAGSAICRNLTVQAISGSTAFGMLRPSARRGELVAGCRGERKPKVTLQRATENYQIKTNLSL